MNRVERLTSRYQRIRYAADRWGVAYIAKKAYPYMVSPLLGDTHPKPNLLIIGAQKCGTSSFHEHLCAELPARSSIIKEVHYFDYHFGKRSMGWYRAHFPRPKGGGPAQIVFESTPNYLSDKRVPARIEKTLGSPRFIVLLRDPVERAYSHYRMRVRNGLENRSFTRAIEDQISNYHAMGFSPENLVDGYWEPVWRDFDYVGKSLYERQIRHWLKTFDAEKFLFIESESLFERPGATMKTVAEFLGMDIPARNSFPERNRHDSQVAAIPAETRMALEALMRRENYGLSEVTGRTFRWLKEV